MADSAKTFATDLRLLSGALAAVPRGREADFLRDLLTSGEISEFANRFRVASRLADGVPYAKIVEETGASSTTVARVAKFLKGDFGGYRAALRAMAGKSGARAAAPAGAARTASPRGRAVSARHHEAHP